MHGDMQQMYASLFERTSFKYGAALWQVARDALAALHGEPDVKEVDDSAESKVCFSDNRHDECQHHAYCCPSAEWSVILKLHGATHPGASWCTQG